MSDYLSTTPPLGHPAANTKYLRLIGSCLIGLVMLYSVSLQAEVIEDGIEGNSLKTMGGTLEVVPKEGFGPSLLFNKKPIDIESDHIKILRKYKIDNKEVILISTQCGGSSCSWINIYILVISPDGSTAIAPYKSKDEHDHGVSAAELSVAPLEINQEGNTLRITAKEYDGRRERTNVWVYQNGFIRKDR